MLMSQVSQSATDVCLQTVHLQSVPASTVIVCRLFDVVACVSGT